MSHPKCAATTTEVLRSIKNRPSKSSRRPPGGRRDSRRRRRAACRRSTAPACGPVPAPPDRPRIPPTAAGTSPRRSRPRSPATGLSFSRPPPAPSLPPPPRTTGCCCAPRRRGAWTLPRRSSSAPWLLYCTGVSHYSHQARTDAPAASQSPRISPSPVVRRRRRRLWSGGWSAGWLVRVFGTWAECGSGEWRRTRHKEEDGRTEEGGRVRSAVQLWRAFAPSRFVSGHGETGVFWESARGGTPKLRHPERQRRRRTVATGAGERRALPYARLDPAVGRRPATRLIGDRRTWLHPPVHAAGGE
jgi:hypothetical protein